jgi:hypothetical protein
MNSGPGSIAVAVAPCVITTWPAGAGRFPGPQPSDPLVGISPSLGRSIPRTTAAEPLGGDSTASPTVDSPDHGHRTRLWGFHRLWAGRFPGSRPPNRSAGIPPPHRVSIPANLRGTVQADASRRRCHGSWQRGRRLRRAES